MKKTTRARAHFGQRTDRQLDRVEQACAARAVRLTEIRRHVLGLVLQSETPVGAYELLDRLRATHRGAAPPTVYRALDFLLEQGLIHKVERLSAFVGCVHEGQDPHLHDVEAHGTHGAQFLICRGCGRVVELDEAEIGQALGTAATRNGFVLHRATVEIEGLCAACAALPG